MEETKGIVRHIQTASDPVVTRIFRGDDKGINCLSFDPNMYTISLNV